MNNDRIIILLINNEDSNPLYNESIKIIIRALTLDEDTNLQSTRLQPVLFQAPTWTSQGSNPISHNVPTLSLWGTNLWGSNPLTGTGSNLIFLRTPIL